MTSPRVVVLDYGFGNVRSAVRALERAGATTLLTADQAAAQDADGLVVPGVGAFAACMDGLSLVNGPEVIDRRLAAGRPVLGICVGMQVMFAEGVEHGVESKGVGRWPGRVERLPATPLPHMGWNTVSVDAGSLDVSLDAGSVAGGSAMFDGVEQERFYFVHSYAARHWELTGSGGPPPVVAWSEHDGDRFVAAVEDGALWATQFHPEKSGDAGAVLLRNWLRRLGA